MGQLRNQLQEVARGQQDKELLTEVEHYHNQFYIQQINIHDLKQAIKNHDRRISLEQSSLNGKLSEQTLSDHEELHSQYENLEHTLSELKIEFTHFLTKA
jgi:hypothetical protein